MTDPRRPVLIEEEALPEAAPDPSNAPPVPDLNTLPPAGGAMTAVTRFAGRRPSRVGRVFWWAVSGLVMLAVSVAAWDFMIDLLTRNVWLGRIALGLGLAALAALLLVALRELAAMARLARVDTLQRRATEALADEDAGAARALSKDLVRFYRGRDELKWAVDEMQARASDILDADALLDLTERQLMAPLDAMARSEIEGAARQVAAATAIVPLALADVVVALVSNIRMVRRIAEIYGGRAGVLGSWRLLRAVATHLIATGAVAVGDDMISSVAGGGVLSKVSRRFGEGVVNGALTARVGIAAMEVCRPLPFATLKRPRVTSLVKRALTGMFGK